MEKVKKRILIVTTSFSPENAVGSIRLTKIVKYLVRQKFEITVISPELHSHSKIDQSLECEELNLVSRILIPQSKFFSKLFLKQRNALLEKNSAPKLLKGNSKTGYINKIKVQLYRFIHFIYTILRNLDWKVEVEKYSILNFSEGQFDVVFSSYPSLGAPWVARYLKKNKIAKTWISDFRDPVNYENNSNFILFRLNAIIQHNIVNNADFITCVSKGISKKIIPTLSSKYIYLPNGFDMDDINKLDLESKDVSLDDTLVISYVGSLYSGERSIKPLFKAIRELSEGVSNFKVKFIYAGKEFNVLNSQASLYDVEYILENRGFVTREEAVSIQVYSDVSVVSTWNTEKDQGILSGKLYECFLTKKPIIGLVNGSKPNSELFDMINMVGAGVCLEESSLNYESEYNQLVVFLLEKFKEKSNLGCITNTYNLNMEEFSYENITSKLSSIFQRSKD
jgi:glycosyltransferase involved in cell wall biosynthesis